MGIRIVVKGADYSASGLPAVKEFVAGFDTAGLEGLWLLEDGSNGSAYASATDSSGAGNHAPLRAGWTAPTKQGYGLQTGTDGAAFVSPVALTQAWTWLMCWETDIPNALAGGNSFPTLISPLSHFSSPGDTGRYVNGTGSTHCQVNLDASGSGATTTNAGLFKAASNWPSPPLASSRITTTPQTVTPSLFAVSYDPTAGTLIVRTLGQIRSFTHDNLKGLFAAYAAPSDQLAFGFMRLGAGMAAVAMQAKLYLMAAYSRALSASELALAVQAAQTRCAARGVTLT